MTVEQLNPGTVVGGRYVIDGFLAQGGFATVYRAHHQEIGRRVAIKVLDPPARNQAGDAFRERFLAEAKLAARIEHPGVVSVFDFGVLDDGRAFIAMDLLDGHDLETALENGPLTAARFLPMFIDCLGALAQGHRQGIVHKDLKPSNLFIVRPNQEGERLVVLDFGIARSFDDPGARVTQEGGFSGTPAYLAPEYIRHQEVSPAIDVYQMGLILIETLTGAQAVSANSSMGYLLAHCLEQVVLPTELLDTQLGEICLCAVAKDPADRFEDALAFREALLNVPREDLLQTRKIVLDRELPEPSQELAKTLQFIEVSPEALEHLSEAEATTAAQRIEPPIEPPPQDNTKPLIALAAVLTLCVVVALAYLVLGVEDPAEEPPPAAPTSTVAVPSAPDLGTRPPDRVVPSLDLGVSDAARDLGAQPDLSVPDLSTEIAAPTPRPRPRPRPAAKPKPKAEDRPRPSKPAKPLLLSP